MDKPDLAERLHLLGPRECRAEWHLSAERSNLVYPQNTYTVPIDAADSRGFCELQVEPAS